MSYLHATIPVAGIQLDTFVTTSDNKVWVTLTSIAQGVGVHRQTVKNWLTRKASPPATIKVVVGVRKKEATAYPVLMAVDFLKFIAQKGNKEAQALLDAIVVADIERSAREANGIQVTAAQHEEVRHNTRLALLQQWVSENYQAVRPSKFANYNRLEESEMTAAGFTDPVEQRILGMEAYIKKTRQFLLDNPEMSKEQQGYYTDGIRSHEKQVQTLAQSLSN